MELLLADNGVGIEKEDLKHIFERLYKCDKGRSEKGSGLGLSIVHQLCLLYTSSDTEMAYFKQLIRNNAHLIIEFSQEGGILNAAG